ncbi:hypothetical protein, partial [Burkholderia multivorans]|uniref:hypothetical protein n=1 Tax=Burkholderia multivorans TaxID=87883 RepID=UPI001C65B91C
SQRSSSKFGDPRLPTGGPRFHGKQSYRPKPGVQFRWRPVSFLGERRRGIDKRAPPIDKIV